MKIYYGPTIQKIRLSKGFTQKEVYSGVVSRSFYVKFEKGETDISVSKFKRILEALSLTFNEFFYIHDDFQNNLDLLTNRIHFFWKEGLYKDLLSVYETYKDSRLEREKQLSLSAYVYLYSVKNEEWQLPKQPIMSYYNYFIDKNFLTIQELNECFFLFKAIDSKHILNLLDICLPSLKRYKKFDYTLYTNLFSQFALVKTQALILEGLKLAALEFLDEFEYEVDTSGTLDSIVNYKTAEIIVGLQFDSQKWHKEILKLKSVMEYLDPETWGENIAMIEAFSRLAEN